MRAEKNPLDLNNLPDDYTRDGKQVLEDTSSSAAGSMKKKIGSKDGKDECDKIYECRFCSLKFCKSQALGGHMNRHRQERETETLYRARQLVFSNNNLLDQGAHHLGGQQIPPGTGSHHQSSNIGDPTLPFRSVYPTRLFSGSSSTLLPPPPPGQPPPQPYIYSSPPSHIIYPSQYPPHPMNDYIVGHVYNTHPYNYSNPNYVSNTNYTCIGAPVGAVGHGFGQGNGSRRGLDMVVLGGGVDGGRDMLQVQNQEEGLNSGRNYIGTQQHLDSSLINRFQDGF